MFDSRSTVVEAFKWGIHSPRLYNPSDQSKTLDLDLIVDTGSTYTWVKQAKLLKK